MSRKSFSNLLALVLHHAGLPLGKYRSHSFRIGVASLAADQGLSDAQIYIFFSDAQIRLMGRWKSNAFKKKHWINSLTTTSFGS